MTEPAQIRLNIEPALRDDFKAVCQNSGTSMAEQTTRMIAEFLARSATANKAGATPAMASDAHQSDGTAEGRSEPADRLSTLLDDKLEPVLDALDHCATQANIEWLNVNLVKEVRTRHNELARSITHAENRIANCVEGSSTKWQSVFTANRRDCYWLGGAALAGMATVAMLLALASGTIAGRKLAIGLTGAKNNWQAALLLAGEGSRLHASLMEETRALLDEPLYREKYADCIDRAMRAKRTIVCKLAMPALIRN